jgi:predicted nicotinamide N-methyase
LSGVFTDDSSDALTRHFVTDEQPVRVGTRTVSLLRPRNADDLISEADYVMDERLPYWADLWPSATVLADSLAAETGGGRTLLELGCGLGLATVAASMAGYDVLATDYYEDALRFTRENARRAGVPVPAVRMVNWRSLPDDLGRFERVIAADVLYESEYGPLVARVLSRTLAPDGVATISDPGRAAGPEFVMECEAVGLRVDTPPAVPYEDGKIRQKIHLHEIRWV